MIQQIEEINFPSYLTLHQATVSFTDMGERTISAQVKIDGDVVPSFIGTDDNPLAIRFKGETFVLPIREPQATKDNSTRNSLVDLNFQSWPIDQMKRYFFADMTQVETDVYVPDRYNASVSLPLASFVTLLNRVLWYYFGDAIAAELNPNVEFPDTPSIVTIEHSYIWDVIQKIYDTYAVRWYIEYDPIGERYMIMIGYPVSKIDDHDFEYGFEGGLLKFERQVQDETVNNILLGRGGEKNVPYRYFKRTDPQNPDWTPDPDAIPELQNVYFDRLRDANFRRYVQGWRTNENRDTSWEEVQPYDSARGEVDFAYKKGHEDDLFNPVEYVKDDESIDKFGERWGYLEDNDDIYPTIQGVIISDFGRIDEVVAVSPITTDDIDTAARAESTTNSLEGVNSMTSYINKGETIHKVIAGGEFAVPVGMTANLSGVAFTSTQPRGRNTLIAIEEFSISVYSTEDDSEVPSQGIIAGTYRYEINIAVWNRHTDQGDTVTYGAKDIKLLMAWQEEAWKPTFDIWVKNLFNTHIGEITGQEDETPEAYALRVWQPILGDRVGNQATVAFSDGFMSISEDYNFVIAKYPEFDQSKSHNGFNSEWKITLRKSDAEYDATGYFIPNSKTGGSPIAGDHFYLLGVDMSHALVETAEEKLNADKTARLSETATTNPTWVVSLDKIRINRQDAGYLQTLFERINAGTEISVKDKRFTNNEALKLIVQSITYTFNEPSDDNPALMPDVEVVLSAKTEAGQSTIEKLQGDIDIVRQSSVQISDIDAIIKRVASQMFLKKSGESDISHSPTKFASKVTSDDFTQGGVGGTGWGTYKDEDGRTVFEMDKLIVRDELKVNSLVVNQIAYVGGREITSAAAMECIQVIEDDHDGEYTDYKCYFDQKQGTVKNLFIVGDIVMSQQFDPTGNEVKYYKMVVTEVGENYIVLNPDGQDGSGYPEIGDVIVQYGNTTYASRQYVIIRDVIGGGSVKMVSGLSGTHTDGYTYFFAGTEIVEEELQDVNGVPLTDYNGQQLMVGVERPGFFVGSDNSHVRYSESEKILRIKGSIVQSPSGSEFPIPCPRGAYSSVTTYYKGDMVTYQGQSWLRVANTAAAGDTPASPNWIIYAERGEAGASPLYRGVYDSTKTYYGDPYRIDIVEYNSVYYRALTTAGTIAAGEIPGVSSKWALFGATFESIATGLLVAKNAVIKNGIITKLQTSETGRRIQAMDNVLEMYDANDTKRLIVTGEEVDITSASTTITPTNINTRFETHYTDDPIDEDYTDVIAGPFNVGINNEISIPAFDIGGVINNPDLEEEEEEEESAGADGEEGGEEEEGGEGGEDIHEDPNAAIYGSLKLQELSGQNWIDVVTVGSFSAFNNGTYGTTTTQKTQKVANSGSYRLVLAYHVDLVIVNEGTRATITLQTSHGSSSIIISDSEQIVKIGQNGFSASLGNDFMMNCARDPENSNARIIEMQGKDSQNRLVGVRISSAGLQITLAGTQYTASRDSNGFLKLNT